MNANLTQTLVSDHIRASREQAAAARQAGAMRSAKRTPCAPAPRRSIGWLARSV